MNTSERIDYILSSNPYSHKSPKTLTQELNALGHNVGEKRVKELARLNRNIEAVKSNDGRIMYYRYIMPESPIATWYHAATWFCSDFTKPLIMTVLIICIYLLGSCMG